MLSAMIPILNEIHTLPGVLIAVIKTLPFARSFMNARRTKARA